VSLRLLCQASRLRRWPERCHSPGRGLFGLVGSKWLTPADIPDDDFRKTMPRFSGTAFEANLKLVRKLEALAQAKGATVGQLALAWVIDNGALPIPGTKRKAYLEENIKAADIAISAEEHKQIRRLLEEIKVEGDRYADMAGTTA
jgi:aryl-alcohol dehydrogenase-like predicted oxidoreductase